MRVEVFIATLLVVAADFVSAASITAQCGCAWQGNSINVSCTVPMTTGATKLSVSPSKDCVVRSLTDFTCLFDDGKAVPITFTVAPSASSGTVDPSELYCQSGTSSVGIIVLCVGLVVVFLVFLICVCRKKAEQDVDPNPPFIPGKVIPKDTKNYGTTEIDLLQITLPRTCSGVAITELGAAASDLVKLLKQRDLSLSVLIDPTLTFTPLTAFFKIPANVQTPPSTARSQTRPSILAQLNVWRVINSPVGVLVDAALQPFHACLPLLGATDIALVAVRDVSRVVELKRAKKTISAYCIFVHHLESATLHDDAPSTSAQYVVAVRDALDDVVPLMERVPGTASSVVPVIKHTNGRELHVFVCGADTDEARAWNEPVLAYIRHVISQQLPRTDVNLGGRLAAALTEAIDDTLGTGEKVVFTPSGDFVVLKPAPHVAVAMPPPLAAGETIVDVPWKLLVEQDWTGETSDPAYVLEFAMTGLNDAAAEANLRAQLAWDAGIKLERRGRAACETLSVVARGPSGQRVRAYTELQEHNIGESGAPLKVNVSPGGLVRIQFWPGQID